MGWVRGGSSFQFVLRKVVFFYKLAVVNQHGETGVWQKEKLFPCVHCYMHGKKRAARPVNTDVCLCFGKTEAGYGGSAAGSCRSGRVLFLRTSRHMFTLSALPTSFHFFFIHWTTNALLPWGVVTQGGMWGYHLLFINTGSGNTPHCQPNPLSLHLVPWQERGWGGVRRYAGPDVQPSWMTGSSPHCCCSG